LPLVITEEVFRKTTDERYESVVCHLAENQEPIRMEYIEAGLLDNSHETHKYCYEYRSDDTVND
jgi:hypothetical protein